VAGIHRLLEDNLAQVTDEVIDRHRFARDREGDSVADLCRGSIAGYGKIVVESSEELRPDVQRLIAELSCFVGRPVERAFGRRPLNP
jgi:hypothetical protein